MNLNDKNFDIFICTHKKFKNPITNNVYKTLSVGNNKELFDSDVIRDNTGDNISDMNGFYSELTGTYWVWKNYDIKEYVGICHYRRYFDFFDDIPNDNEDYDIILPTPEFFSESVYQHYAKNHNEKDLKLVCDIMVDKYNVPHEIINEVFNNQTYMHCCNMFITNKTIFNEYCEFIFGIMDEYLKYNNISNINDIYNMIENNKNEYLKELYPNNDIKYQSRIGGCCGERLLNIFVKWKGLKIKCVNIAYTEQKYIEKLESDFI